MSGEQDSGFPFLSGDVVADFEIEVPGYQIQHLKSVRVRTEITIDIEDYSDEYLFRYRDTVAMYEKWIT